MEMASNSAMYVCFLILLYFIFLIMILDVLKLVEILLK